MIFNHPSTIIYTTLNLTSVKGDSSKKRIVKWTIHEEEKLQELVKIHGKSWSVISKAFDDKTNYQCFYHFWKNLDPRSKKWSHDEDKKMILFLKENGRSWRACAIHLEKKPKECYERFKILKNKYSVKTKISWKLEEEYKLLLLVSKIGKCWNKIKLCFSGKTKNTICKKFYSLLRNYVKKHEDPLFNKIQYCLTSLMKFLPATIIHFQNKIKSKLLYRTN